LYLGKSKRYVPYNGCVLKYFTLISVHPIPDKKLNEMVANGWSLVSVDWNPPHGVTRSVQGIFSALFSRVEEI